MKIRFLLDENISPRLKIAITRLSLARELHLVWEASEAEEWLDRLDWIPL